MLNRERRRRRRRREGGVEYSFRILEMEMMIVVMMNKYGIKNRQLAPS